jgi:proteic killer suppression protein|tara:strand:+ start:254 stop:544 length:291 start_codon:yes stop_codon:yes gene_type:complete
VIKKISGKTTRDIYDGVNSKSARNLQKALHPKARRLVDQINSAPSLNFLNIPPGNKLEKLSGDYKGFWSIRINDQWRIVFRWEENNAFDVEIVDYH